MTAVNRPPAYRRAPAVLPPHPDAERLRSAIQRLGANPDFHAVIGWLKAREYERFAVMDPNDSGALSLCAARHSLMKELETLDQQVADDRRGEQSR